MLAFTLGALYSAEIAGLQGTIAGISASSILVAAFGSGAGAAVAFAIQNIREDAAERRRQINAINRALYSLFHYWNGARQYQKEVIEPTGRGPDRWLNLMVTVTHDAVLKADVRPNEISFLLDDNSWLYSRLQLEFWRAVTLGELIAEHRKLHLDYVYPAIHRLGIKRGQQMDPQPLLDALGEPTVLRLKVLADSLVQTTNENVESTKAVFLDLSSAMRERHPGVKFVKCDFEG